MKETILLVDDEEEIISFMKDSLEDEGYDVLIAYDGCAAVEQAKKQPDAIVLDIMLPHMDGYEVCQLIRDQVACPILFLSARQSETDRVRGLAIGGDDYLVKPFSMRELKARIAAHLRREKRREVRQAAGLLRFGSLTIDVKGHDVCLYGEQVLLTNREFAIVELLALHPGQVFSREQIYEKVWGYDAMGDDATVTEHIKKIRAKIASLDPVTSYIATVWGVGYKWERV